MTIMILEKNKQRNKNVNKQRKHLLVTEVRFARLRGK